MVNAKGECETHGARLAVAKEAGDYQDFATFLALGGKSCDVPLPPPPIQLSRYGLVGQWSNANFLSRKVGVLILLPVLPGQLLSGGSC